VGGGEREGRGEIPSVGLVIGGGMRGVRGEEGEGRRWDQGVEIGRERGGRGRGRLEQMGEGRVGGLDWGGEGAGGGVK